MSIIIRRPWTRQPQTAVGIDWGNPLTRGLVHLIHPPVGDLVNKVRPAYNSNPDTSTALTVADRGICVTNTSNSVGLACGASRFTTSDGAGTGDFTCAVFAKPTARASRTITLASLSGSSPESYLTLNGAKNDTNSSGKFAFTWAGKGIDADGVDGNWHLFSVSRVGGAMSIYLDGKPAPNSSSTADGTSIYRASTLYIGGYTVAFYGFRGDVALLMLFANRGWAQAEHMALAQNVFQLFAPQTQRIWTPAAASTYTLGAPTYVPGSITSTGFLPRIPVTVA